MSIGEQVKELKAQQIKDTASKDHLNRIKNMEKVKSWAESYLTEYILKAVNQPELWSVETFRPYFVSHTFIEFEHVTKESYGLTSFYISKDEAEIYRGMFQDVADQISSQLQAEFESNNIGLVVYTKYDGQNEFGGLGYRLIANFKETQQKIEEKKLKSEIRSSFSALYKKNASSEEINSRVEREYLSRTQPEIKTSSGFSTLLWIVVFVLIGIGVVTLIGNGA